MNVNNFAHLKVPRMVLPAAVIALAVVIDVPFAAQMQPGQNSALADPPGRNTVNPNSGGTMWSSFGALSGKDSPGSPVKPTVPVVPAPKPIAPAQKTAAPAHKGVPAIYLRRATFKPTAQDHRKMWEMGTWIGSAAMANMMPAMLQTDVDVMYKSAVDIARKYEVLIEPLPARTGVKATDMRANLMYVMKDLRNSLIYMDVKYGHKEEAIVEIAIKVQLLRAVYQPGDEEGKSIIKEIKAAEVYAFPSSQILKPLIQSVERGAPFKEVNARIAELDKLVTDYFSKQK